MLSGRKFGRNNLRLLLGHRNQQGTQNKLCFPTVEEKQRYNQIHGYEQHEPETPRKRHLHNAFIEFNKSTHGSILSEHIFMVFDFYKTDHCCFTSVSPMLNLALSASVLLKPSDEQPLSCLSRSSPESLALDTRSGRHLLPARSALYRTGGTQDS